MGRSLGSGLLFVVLLSGCGGGAPADAPSTAPVKGKITRKGQPFPGVSVTYQPLEAKEGNSSPSVGGTDPNGAYEMILNRNTMGVVPGKCQVRLKAQDGLDDDDPTKKAPNEVVIPTNLELHEVTVPPEGLDGGAADIDLDF